MARRQPHYSALYFLLGFVKAPPPANERKGVYGSRTSSSVSWLRIRLRRFPTPVKAVPCTSKSRPNAYHVNGQDAIPQFASHRATSQHNLSRSMQLIQFILAVIVVLLASSCDFATAAKCGVKTATDNLRTAEPIQAINLAASPATDEERGAQNAGAAARVIGGASVPVNGPPATVGGEMVTVTTFNGNGFFQRMGKWLKRTLDSGDEKTRRIRQ
ncbi:hypothetical protein GQ600_25415 [Phytophthora cactorum]|nr:hypothetical protein GQ600_25415 [Phytophthora cactorum]